MSQKNTNLNTAKSAKNDEFYTLYADIEKEVSHYHKYLKNKIVFCNCDDPEWSEFWKYFHINFSFLGLKKLVSTHYGKDKVSYKLEYCGGNDSDTSAGTKTPLLGNGDFRSEESIKILKGCDIVITNPPFSLFREFIAQLIEYNKQFLVIGNLNAAKYKEIFPYIANNQLWLGYNAVHTFKQPNGELKKFGNIYWYTNVDTDKRHQPLMLDKKYDSKNYKKYDTFDAIDVGKVSNIPEDYPGIMGVPISYLTKHCPQQFEIVGEFNHGCDNSFDLAKPIIEGKELFPRIAIRKK